MMSLFARFADSPWLQWPARPLVIGLSLAALVGCSMGRDDLAANKLSKSEVQSSSFLRLNADKPGAKVELKRFLVPGKYTLVVYFSPYDGVGPTLEGPLLKLSQTAEGPAVRTINVNRANVQGIDWQSPALEDVQCQALPYFRIYDPSMRLRAHGRPAYEQVSQWLQYLN